MSKRVFEGALPKGGWLQLFAGDAAVTDPNQGGKPGGGAGDPNQQPKTYTEEELQARIKAEAKKAADAAAANARRATEAEFKPKLEAAQQAVDAAKPFLDNPTQYMAQFLATNPALIQVVADATDRMLKGGVPTQAQIAAVGKAAEGSTDPKVAQKLEKLEQELTAVREAGQEERELKSELKTYAKDFETAGLEWDADAFLEYVNKYAEENEIGDEDFIDTRALFRAYKAEQQLAAKGKVRAPKLPGGGALPPGPKPAEKPKSWDDAAAQAIERLRAARDQD